MKTKELQDLLEYFGREQACYTSLLDLSRQQKQLIEEGDIDQLLTTLGHKQQILGRVAEIETKLRPYKDRWSDLRLTMSTDDRSMIDLALSTVEDLLSELISTEQDCEKLLVGQINVVQNDLEEVSTAQGVNDAYSMAARPESSHLLNYRETL